MPSEAMMCTSRLSAAVHTLQHTHFENHKKIVVRELASSRESHSGFQSFSAARANKPGNFVGGLYHVSVS